MLAYSWGLRRSKDGNIDSPRPLGRILRVELHGLPFPQRIEFAITGGEMEKHFCATTLYSNEAEAFVLDFLFDRTVCHGKFEE